MKAILALVGIAWTFGSYAFDEDLLQLACEKQLSPLLQIACEVLAAEESNNTIAPERCMGYFAINPASGMPIEGVEYAMSGGNLRYAQIVPGGVIVSADGEDELPFIRRLFVKMPTAGISVGDLVPGGWAVGAGSYSYTTILGSHCVVPAFVKLSPKETAERERKRNEATEWTRSQGARQDVRAAYAEWRARELSFEMISEIFVEKELAPVANEIGFEVRHFLFEPLKKAQAEGRWLSVLNIVYDLVHDTGDMTYHYQEFPPLSEIKSLYYELSDQGKMDIIWKLPKGKSCSLMQITYGPQAATGSIWMPDSFRPINLDLKFSRQASLGRSSATVVYVGNARTIDCVLGKNGYDWEKKKPTGFEIKMRELREEQEKISEASGKREISRTVAAQRLNKLNEAFKKLLGEHFLRLSDTESIAKAQREWQMKIEMAKERLEADKAQLFKRIEALSFDVADHVKVQKALMPYIHSVEVVRRNRWDVDWAVMKKLHEEKDYMGLLREVAKVHNINFDETDFKCYLAAEQALLRSSFDVHFELTHRIIVHCKNWDMQEKKLFDSVERFDSMPGLCDTSFSLGEKRLDLFYANQWNVRDTAPDREERLGDLAEEEERERALCRQDAYFHDILNWLDTAPFKPNSPLEDPILHRSPRNVSLLIKRKKPVAIPAAVAKKDKAAFEKVLKDISVAIKADKKQYKQEQRVRWLVKVMSDKTIVRLCERYTGVKCAGELEKFKKEWKAADKAANAAHMVVIDEDEIERQKSAIANKIAALKAERAALKAERDECMRVQGRLLRVPPRVSQIDREVRALESEKVKISQSKSSAARRQEEARREAMKKQRNEIYAKYKTMVVDDVRSAIDQSAIEERAK